MVNCTQSRRASFARSLSSCHWRRHWFGPRLHYPRALLGILWQQAQALVRCVAHFSGPTLFLIQGHTTPCSPPTPSSSTPTWLVALTMRFPTTCATAGSLDIKRSTYWTLHQPQPSDAQEGSLLTALTAPSTWTRQATSCLTLASISFLPRTRL